MPVIDTFARCAPLGPGRVCFTLLKFNGPQELGPRLEMLDLLVVRRNEERLADWLSQSPDGFMLIKPKAFRQRALNFEFVVGPEVVNAMAFDNSGDYILKIRNKNGAIRSFNVSMQGMLVADNSFVPGNEPPVRRPTRMEMEDRAMQQARAEYLERGNQRARNPQDRVRDNHQARSQARPDHYARQEVNYKQDMENPQDLYAQAAYAMPIREQKPAKSSVMRIVLIVVMFILVLVLGFVGFKFYQSLSGSDAPSAPAPAQDSLKAQEEAARRALEQQQLQQQQQAMQQQPQPVISSIEACQIFNQHGDDKEIIARCLATNPSDRELFAVLAESLRTQRCEIALRVLRTKGRGNNVDSAIFAFIYSQLADPEVRLFSNCIAKSPSERDYWLSKAVQVPDFDVQLGQTALEVLVRDIVNGGQSAGQNAAPSPNGAQNGGQNPNGYQNQGGGQNPNGYQNQGGGQNPNGYQNQGGGQNPNGYQNQGGGQNPNGYQNPNGGQYAN